MATTSRQASSLSPENNTLVREFAEALVLPLAKRTLVPGSLFYERVLTHVVKPIAQIYSSLAPLSPSPRALKFDLTVMAELYLRTLRDPLSLPSLVPISPISRTEWERWLDMDLELSSRNSDATSHPPLPTIPYEKAKSDVCLERAFIQALSGQNECHPRNAASMPPNDRYVLASALTLLEQIGRDYCDETLSSSFNHVFPDVAFIVVDGHRTREETAAELVDALARSLWKKKFLPAKAGPYQRIIKEILQPIIEVQLYLTPYCDAEKLERACHSLAEEAIQHSTRSPPLLLLNLGRRKWMTAVEWKVWLQNTCDETEHSMSAADIEGLSELLPRLHHTEIGSGPLQEALLSVLWPQEWLDLFVPFPPRRRHLPAEALMASLGRPTRRRRKSKPLMKVIFDKQKHRCSREQSPETSNKQKGV